MSEVQAVIPAPESWRVKDGLCTYCGLPPLDGDEYPEPYTGWSCVVCGAQTGSFE